MRRKNWFQIMLASSAMTIPAALVGCESDGVDWSDDEQRADTTLHDAQDSSARRDYDGAYNERELQRYNQQDGRQQPMNQDEQQTFGTFDESGQGAASDQANLDANRPTGPIEERWDAGEGVLDTDIMGTDQTGDLNRPSGEMQTDQPDLDVDVDVEPDTGDMHDHGSDNTLRDGNLEQIDPADSGRSGNLY